MLSWLRLRLSRSASMILFCYSLAAIAINGWLWHTKQDLQARPPMRVIDVSRQIEMLNREVTLYVQALSETSNPAQARLLWSRVQARQHTIQGLLRHFVDLESNFKVLELQIEQLRQLVEHPPEHLARAELTEFVDNIREDMDIFASDVHRTMQLIIADQTRQLHRYSTAVAWLSLAMFISGFALLTLIILLSKQNQKLVKLATEDDLTGLLNRRSAMLQGKLLASMAQRNQQPLALALLDVDQFRQINDVYGHPAGDAALKMLAQVLRTYAQRDTDVVARIGDEEFLLLMPDTSEEVAWQLCSVLLSALADIQIDAANNVKLTASAGLAVSKQGHYDFDALYRMAEAALYQARAAGHNQLKSAEYPRLSD